MTDRARPQKTAFKDYFDREAARALSAQIVSAYPRFDGSRFVRRATKGLEDLAFAQRVRQFSDALRAGLPDDTPRALGILVDSLPSPLPDCESVTDGWLQWPLGQLIADHGLEYFEPSMEAMIALTQRFSSEFAVRPFVEHRAKETFARLRKLTGHRSPHVRRWCSEGVRPRLPWGKKLTSLIEDPRPIWSILEALKDDDERYVIRSVANTMNDIAKDHPEQVVERCRAWARGGGRRWVVEHALRTLVKDGDPGALAVVGFGAPKRLQARLTVRPARIGIGQAVVFTAELVNGAAQAQELIIDYAVHYVRSGGRTSAKVFKWTRTRIEPRETLTVDKRHSMRPTTIRALYPGVHRVGVQVNGQTLAEAEFVLAGA